MVVKLFMPLLILVNLQTHLVLHYLLIILLLLVVVVLVDPMVVLLVAQVE
jgi:hypothetical protein